MQTGQSREGIKMTALFKTGLILLVSLILTACPFEGSINSPTIPTLSTRQITVSGGEIMSGDQRLTLTFPSGALTGPTEITITSLSAAEITEQYPGEEIDFIYELGPDGSTFSVPVHVSILLPDTADLNTPRTFLISSNGIVQPLDNVSYNTTTGVISGTLSHFSTLYAVSLPFIFEKVVATSSEVLGYDVRHTNDGRVFLGEIRTVDSFTPVAGKGDQVISNLRHVDLLNFNNDVDFPFYKNHPEDEALIVTDKRGFIDFNCTNSAGGIDTIHFRISYS